MERGYERNSSSKMEFGRNKTNRKPGSSDSGPKKTNYFDSEGKVQPVPTLAEKIETAFVKQLSILLCKYVQQFQFCVVV